MELLRFRRAFIYSIPKILFGSDKRLESSFGSFEEGKEVIENSLLERRALFLAEG